MGEVRTLSLSFEKRSTAQRNEIRVRLLVLDERTGDVITDLVLTDQEYTALCSSQVIRINEQ